MQLVGCAPTSGLWGLWNNHFTVLFFVSARAAEPHRQCRVTEESASCMRHSLLPTGGAVENLSLHRWSLISPGMKILYVHPAPFLSWRLSSVCAHLHLSMCVCDFLTSVFAFVLDRQTASWLDWIHSSFPSYITLFQLCFSLCHLFPCAMEQKLSLEWLDITLLTLCPLPFMLSLLKKSFESDLLFIFLLILITFWVVWKNIGLTSLQTVACWYFHPSVGFFHEPKPTTATSNYSAAGRATCADSFDIPLPVEQIWERISLTDGFSHVSTWDKGLFLWIDSSIQLQWTERITAG